MFEDIEKMENEIDLFRKNMLASSDLVEGITSLVQETQKQQALIKQISSDYQEEMKKIASDAIDNVQTKHKEVLNTISDKEKDTIEKVEKAAAENIQNAVTELKDKNKEYVEKFTKVCSDLQNMEVALEHKYEECARILENEGKRTSDLFKMIGDLKEVVKKKLMLVTIFSCVQAGLFLTCIVVLVLALKGL